MKERREDHFPLFDAFRGLAALAVVAVHGFYQPAVSARVGRSFWDWTVHLDVAVPIFFGVSGFLLWRPFVAARLKGTQFRLPAYAWRRFLRITPGYWVALTLIAVIWLARPEIQNLKGVIRFYGFGQIYRGQTAIEGLGQAWTLCVEVSFYIVLPALFMAMRRLLRGREKTFWYDLGVLIAIYALSWVWKFWAVGRMDPSAVKDLPYQLSIPAWFDTLALGMMLAVVSAHAADRNGKPGEAAGIAARLDRVPAGVWIGLSFLAYLGSVYIGFDGTPEHPLTDNTYLVDHFTDGLCVLFLLMPGVFGRTDEGFIRKRILSFKPLLYVGTISYSIYLYHYVMTVKLIEWYNGVPGSVGGWIVWMLAMYGAAIGFGTIGFYLIERPFMNLKRFVPAYIPPPGPPGPPPTALTEAGDEVPAAAPGDLPEGEPGSQDPEPEHTSI